ncbi:NAD(P)/FAD-dependent oxidoreductase [Humisphaera borealis]|uniref:FAD-dependent oxidoreductase n=1 Tax=Humisphaera borealis TaxID=2807512 RepID=A0A7M2WQV1_9BACT|nr:FAD-dependent oxidoreductase [Humisphaera borealis]QOV87846.1 FAD-dependent oxidoreductase [Humisphaera borealis]
MTVLHVKYLLVGGGAASIAAAKAIRSLDVEGSMLVVGREVHRPYLRPELSRRYLRRESTREQLYLDDPDWFNRHHVALKTGRNVSRIDPPRSAATLDSGEEVSYDFLLIATGATAAGLAIPGAQLPNLFSLRTIDDADLLRNAVETAIHEGRPHGELSELPRARGRVAVIGAGLLGVEVSASLRRMGMAVDLISGSEHPWAKQAGEATGRFVAKLLAKHGVTLHAGRHPLRLEGDSRVQRVVLDDAAKTTLDCDFAVACVGAVATKDLLRGTTIGAGKSILVDSTGRTSVPNIFAAGDCCAILDPRFGKHRWLEHWDGAQATATLAGRNMAGANETFTALPGFETEIFGVKARGWGESRLVDRRLIRGSTAADTGFAEIGIAKDGRVAQVLVVGDLDETAALRQLVWDRVNVSGREDSLRDPAVALS